MSGDFFDVSKEPNLQDLRCVDVRTAPTGFEAWKRQFITFRSQTDPNPLWTDLAKPGFACGFDEWASPSAPIGPKRLSSEELVDLIQNASTAISSMRSIKRPGIAANLPECFTIIELSMEKKS
jgi:hypothetical protein